MTQTELDNLWFHQEPIPSATFTLNESVRVTNGAYPGKLGSVISLVSLEPLPVYIIELGSGGVTIQVAQTNPESVV